MTICETALGFLQVGTALSLTNIDFWRNCQNSDQNQNEIQLHRARFESLVRWKPLKIGEQPHFDRPDTVPKVADELKLPKIFLVSKFSREWHKKRHRKYFLKFSRKKNIFLILSNDFLRLLRKLFLAVWIRDSGDLGQIKLPKSDNSD
jgi:hypothetical protein